MEYYFDTFIYAKSIVGTMEKQEAFMRFGGGVFIAAGLLLIFLSGKLVGGSPMDPSDNLAEFMMRAGFGVLLVGLLSVFLFSVKTVPRELMDPLLKTEGQNLGRLFEGLELRGNGIYIPSSGRLTEDRVYIPAEPKPLPLPKLASEQVLIVGTTGPSMGLSIIPPGKGLIDRIEKDTGRRFAEDDLSDISEALERISKGTGMIGSISARMKDDRISVQIVHSKFLEVCQEAWESDPELHLKVGCPGCSCVLGAVSRISRSPIRIISAEMKGKKVRYELERW